MALADTDEADIDIDDLEHRIETLTAEVLRCRKFALAARVAVGGGIAAFALLLMGVLPFRPEILLATLAAVIGGIVLMGSNASTWTQTEEALRTAEQQRRDLIGRMPLRLVAEEHSTPN